MDRIARTATAGLLAGLALLGSTGTAQAAFDPNRPCTVYGYAVGIARQESESLAAARAFAEATGGVVINRSCGQSVWYDEYGNRMDAKGSAPAV